MDVKKIQKILVVDDDPVQLRLLDKVLTEKGFTVTVSDEAANGLQLAMTVELDLIILDVMMPIINGYNFCKLLKSDAVKSRIPVILVTARNEQEDIQIGLEMGAEAYLCKPIETRELLKVITMVESNLRA